MSVIGFIATDLLIIPKDFYLEQLFLELSGRPEITPTVCLDDSHLTKNIDNCSVYFSN